MVLLFAAFWNGILSVFIWQIVRSWQHKTGDFMTKWFLPIFLIPFVVVGLALLVSIIYFFLAMFNPRPVVTASSRSVPLGGTLKLEWKVPRGSGRLERLTIELVGREQSTLRRGKQSHTETNSFLTIPITNSSNRLDIQNGQGQIVIPATTMHSFRTAHNSISWVVRLQGTIRLWPDISEEYPIDVLP